MQRFNIKCFITSVFCFFNSFLLKYCIPWSETIVNMLHIGKNKHFGMSLKSPIRWFWSSWTCQAELVTEAVLKKVHGFFTDDFGLKCQSDWMFKVKSIQGGFDCQLIVRPLLLACTLCCSTHTVDKSLQIKSLFILALLIYTTLINQAIYITLMYSVFLSLTTYSSGLGWAGTVLRQR